MTTARTVRSIDILIAQKQVADGVPADVALRSLAVKALSPQERAVYDLLADFAHYDSQGIALALGIKQNHAAGLLKTLWDLGLIAREPLLDGVGRMYVYWGE